MSETCQRVGSIGDWHDVLPIKHRKMLVHRAGDHGDGAEILLIDILALAVEKMRTKLAHAGSRQEA